MRSESKAMRRGRNGDGLTHDTNSRGCSPFRRLLTVVVLFSFSFQLGRFYLATFADPHLCPEESPGYVAGTHGGHDHHAVQGITQACANSYRRSMPALTIV